MPETITLSAAAVMALRFAIKGWRPKAKQRQLPAYRELAAAGIMERVPGSEDEYRFTEDGFARREETLREAEERIERARFEPPDASRLSGAPWKLLRRRVAGEDVPVDDGTKPAYRELAEARIMLPVHSFAGGREVDYTFTYWGYKLRFELMERKSAREPARRDMPGSEAEC
jgi:hypothetical protein